MIRVMICCVIASIFVGCASTKSSNITYEEYKPQKSTKQLHVKEKKEFLPINGIVKGNVVVHTYDKDLWNYEVEGKDTNNQKLSYAKFTHTKSVAKKGDYVYAVIKNGKLKELFLIERANYKQKHTKKIKRDKTKTYKRTKRRQVLSVPTTQSITL